MPNLFAETDEIADGFLKLIFVRPSVGKRIWIAWSKVGLVDTTMLIPSTRKLYEVFHLFATFCVARLGYGSLGFLPLERILSNLFFRFLRTLLSD